MTGHGMPPPPAGGVGGGAFDQAQQAVLGQGTQIIHFHGGQGAGAQGAPDTLVPPPALTGRAAEMEWFARVRAQAQAEGRPVLVSAVHGMGGAGKTALARHLAARVAPEFPDGRFEVDLLGFTPGHRPRDPGEILAELLALAGYPASAVPSGADDKAGLWRSWLSRRRVLLVLDNAHDTHQIQPLLPGPGLHGGCLVVVTSRNRLADLDTAARISVDALPLSDAIALLVAMARRTAAEMRATEAELAELARLCGCLPLALRPAGALLEHVSPAELIEVMLSAEYPLQHLTEADKAATAAFTVSYQALTPSQQDTLRACGWHPGPDFDATSIAALTGRPQPLIAIRLAELRNRNMLISTLRGRYTFHDLFLTYTRRHTTTSPETLDDALDRLYQALQAITEAATSTLTQTTAVPPFTTPGQAKEWIVAATSELHTAAHAALADERPQAQDLVYEVGWWLRITGLYHHARALYQRAHDLCEAVGDRFFQANSLLGLGEAARMQNRYGEAEDFYRRAHDLYGSIGEQSGQAYALKGLGDVAYMQIRYEETEDLYRRAHDLYGSIGEQAGQANALIGLGATAGMQDRYEEAEDLYRRAYDLCETLGDRFFQAKALNGLGAVVYRQVRYEEAEDLYRRAYDLCETIGDRFLQANALMGLADVAYMQVRYGEAEDLYRRAQDLYEMTGERSGQANAALGRARLAQAQEQWDQAAAFYASAERIYQDLGFDYWAAHCSDQIALLGEGPHDG